MAFISFNTRVVEHRTRLVCLGGTPSPRVRCRLALVTYLLTYLRFSEFRTKSPFRAWSFNQRHGRRGMADLLRRPGCPGHRGAGTFFRTSQDYDSCIW